jgi:DNA-binding transcriptional ArsR family regulator
MAAHKRNPEVVAAATEMVGLLDSALLRAVSEPARRELLRVLLLEGPSRITDLARHLPQDRSVISRHLQVMESAGLVASLWEGRERIYSLDGARLVSGLEHLVKRARAQMALCCPPLKPGARRRRG